MLDGADLKELEFVRILGAPYFVAHYVNRDASTPDRGRLHQPYPFDG
jgi:hypothetical protein